MDGKGIHKNYLNQECFLDKDYRFNSEKLLRDMQLAKMEIDMARNMFNNVEDNALIDIAIYSEDLAKKRYGYLLSISFSRNNTTIYNNKVTKMANEDNIKWDNRIDIIVYSKYNRSQP